MAKVQSVYDVEIKFMGKVFPRCVKADQFLPCFGVRVPDMIFQIKAAGPDQSRIKGLIGICGTYHKNSGSRAESIHFIQHSRNNTVIFLVDPGTRIIPSFADAVKFVNKNDTGPVSAGFTE